MSRLEAAGIRVVAISNDAPEVVRDWRRREGLTFTILSDPQMETIRRYDLLDPNEDVARPAEFLLDRSGIVRWRNLTGDYYVRAKPEQVLEAAKGLQ